MRVFEPLKANHPLVTDKTTCPVCHKTFREGQRTMLVPVREPSDHAEIVQALPVHATCSLFGHVSMVGTIVRIKDGDGSPFPVETTDHRQWKLSEAGLE